MADYNLCVLQGVMAGDPDYVTTAKGVNGVRFYVSLKRATGDGKTVWDSFHVCAFGELADKVHRLCHKGTRMLVRGQLQPLPYGAGCDIRADEINVDYVPAARGNAYAAEGGNT